jgi:hypothetical protein
MFLNSFGRVWHPDVLIINAVSGANAEPAAIYHRQKKSSPRVRVDNDTSAFGELVFGGYS